MAYALTSEVTLASAAELEVIATLREKLEPELKALKDAGKDFLHTTGDIFFTRMLRGCNGNVDETVEWYRKFVELRATYKLDDIHLECEKNGVNWDASKMPHSEEMTKYINTSFDEKTLRTEKGLLVWYDSMGDARSQALLAEMSEEKIIKYFHTTFERRTSTLDRISREEGRIVKILRVMDCEGAGFWQLNRQWQKYEKQMLYPVLLGTSIETVHLVFVTNFPSFFVKFFEIFKVIIPPRLLARFRLLDGDYMKDKEYLAEVGPEINKKLVATNKSHDAEGGGCITGAADNYEGTNQTIPAADTMERIMSVTAGQKVTWDFTMGKGDEVSSEKSGFFARMASKFSGSEIMFSANAIWTDKMPHEIPKIAAKVRSAGASDGDEASFWVDGKQIDYSAGAGVNIIAIDLETQEQVLSKSYDLCKDDNLNTQLASDLNALPRKTMVLVAVKGGGAEELTADAWAALENCGAVLKEGHWQKGYALVGTRGGACIAEARGADVVAEGEVPAFEVDAELLAPREISIESGNQTGSLQADRGGMIILKWSNMHCFLANKAVANFKMTLEGGSDGGYPAK